MNILAFICMLFSFLMVIHSWIENDMLAALGWLMALAGWSILFISDTWETTDSKSIEMEKAKLEAFNKLMELPKEPK